MTVSVNGTESQTADKSAATNPGALRLESITAGYGQTTVLRDVSLTVMPGEVLALLGSNGAGKTTTMRAAAGVLSPSSGRILLNGVDVTRASAHRRTNSGLCLVPEGRGVFKSLTVRENLRLFVRDSKGTSGGIERALDAFPALAKRQGALAGSLSGGQQQMLALARAFGTDPEVVLLDEVSMGLAPVVVDEIFVALEALAARGVAMLLVEQYVSRALAVANKVVLLNKGSVAFEGTPSDLDAEAVVSGYLGDDLDREPDHSG